MHTLYSGPAHRFMCDMHKTSCHRASSKSIYPRWFRWVRTLGPTSTVIYMHKIDLIMAMSGVFTLYSLTCWSIGRSSPLSPHFFIYGENDRKIVEITQFMFISFHLLAAWINMWNIKRSMRRTQRWEETMNTQKKQCKMCTQCTQHNMTKADSSFWRWATATTTTTVK